MKYLLLLLTLFSLAFSAEIDEFASDVNYLRDYKEAVKFAKEENKMVMLVLVGDYCPWCKKFEKKTLKSKDVKTFVDENFVAVVVDKYKDKGSYPDEFYAPLIPAVYFINPSTQKSVLDTVAYMKKKEYIENMEDALGLYENEK